MQKSHGACLPCSHVWLGLGSLLKQWHTKNIRLKVKHAVTGIILLYSMFAHTTHACKQHIMWQSKVKLVGKGLFSLNLPFLNSSPSYTSNSSSQKQPSSFCLCLCAKPPSGYTELGYTTDRNLFSHQLTAHVSQQTLTLSYVKTQESGQHLWAQRWQNEWTSWKYLKNPPVDNVHKTSF